MTPVSPRKRFFFLSTRAWSVALLILAATAMVAAQQPTFRSNVELITADIQVVDGEGRPILGLAADHFSVKVSNRTQRVVSADYVDFEKLGRTAADGSASGVTGLVRADDGRMIIIAIDTLSFQSSVSTGVIGAAKAFLRHLGPNDQVGVYPYPQGLMLNPTTDHAAVSMILDKVQGARSMQTGSPFRLRPSEIIDLATSFRSANPDASAEQAISRECGAIRDDDGSLILDSTRRNFNCEERLRLEVQSTVTLMELIASQSVGGLRDVLSRLETLPGRKTVVLLTAGMLSSDRPGGRPDIEDLSVLAGQDAARANATVYPIYIDTRYLERNSAETRKADMNMTTTARRDMDAMASWAERFSGMAGGFAVRDLLGRGEIGFDRILRETAGYYRLGIDMGTVERNGKFQRIAVTVRAPKATVRGRPWVIVPRKTS